MNKKLTPLEALEEIKKYSKVVVNSKEIMIIENTLRAFAIASYNNLDFNFIRIAESWGQYQAIFKAYHFDIPIRKEDYKLIKEVLSYYEK